MVKHRSVSYARTIRRGDIMVTPRRSTPRRTLSISTGGSSRSSIGFARTPTPRRPVSLGSYYSGSNRSRRSSIQSNASSYDGHGNPANPRTAKVTRTKRKIKNKGRRLVHVSSQLRQKIGRVIDSKAIHGYYQDNRIETIDPGALAGKQQVDRFPNTAAASKGGLLFNYDRVLHAASRLWNGKAPNASGPDIADVNNFRPEDTIIDVNKQWWTFRLRNNSARTASIRVYTCQKKNSQVLLSDALGSWFNGIAQMVTTGELIGSPSVTVNSLHTGPTLSDQFRAGWKSECRKIQLEPGQEYNFNVEGPKMRYDGKKFYDTSTYTRNQIQDIQMFWAMNADLVGTHAADGTLNNFGHAPDPAVGGVQERVIVESTYHVSMSMPEKVGGVSTAAGSIFQNGNRVKRVVVDDGQAVTFGTNIHRRDEEDPQSEVNITA